MKRTSCTSCLNDFESPLYCCPQCDVQACPECLVSWWTEKSHCVCFNGCQVSFFRLQQSKPSWNDPLLFGKWYNKLADTIQAFHGNMFHARTKQLKAFKHTHVLDEQIKDFEKQIRTTFNMKSSRLIQKAIEHPWCSCGPCTTKYKQLTHTANSSWTRIIHHLEDILAKPWECDRITLDMADDEIGVFPIIGWVLSCSMALERDDLSGDVQDRMLAKYMATKDVYARVVSFCDDGEKLAARKVWDAHRYFLFFDSPLYEHFDKRVGEMTGFGRQPPTKFPGKSKKRVICTGCGQQIPRTDRNVFRCDTGGCDEGQPTYLQFVDAGYHPSTALSFVAAHVIRPTRISELSIPNGCIVHDVWKKRLDFLLVCRAEINAVGRQAANLHMSRQTLVDTMLDIQLSGYNVETQQDTTLSKKPYFSVIKCSNSNCHGLVDFGGPSSDCLACETPHCQACWKPCQENHQCCQPDVEHVACVQKECIQCVACRTTIEKISGCSHMYCTACHTGWNEHSQEILGGIVMNPHFFESIDRMNQANDEHRPGYTFSGPPSGWALATGERARKQPSLRHAGYVYHGACAYMFDCALQSYHEPQFAQDFRRIIMEVYPMLHLASEAFAETDETKWESSQPRLLEFVQWANAYFRGTHLSTHYGRIMYEWSSA